MSIINLSYERFKRMQRKDWGNGDVNYKQRLGLKLKTDELSAFVKQKSVNYYTSLKQLELEFEGGNHDHQKGKISI